MGTSRYLAIAAALALRTQHATIPQVAPTQHSAVVRLPALRGGSVVVEALNGKAVLLSVPPAGFVVYR